MWLFTTSGFISAVYKDGALQVRARDKASLAPLAKVLGEKITQTPLADYPYRLATNPDDFAEWVATQVIEIDYSNFKSEVAATRGYDFAKPLMKVWSAMHEVEDAGART